MTTKRFRVKMTRNPDFIAALVRAIMLKHNADGANSPLHSLPMLVLANKSQAAADKHTAMLQLKRDSELVTEKRNLILGYNAVSQNFSRQVEGTILFYIASVRDVLMGNFRENPRKLGEWGFTVDARDRVVLPTNADKITVLGQNILQKHTADGANSLLNKLNMADFLEKQNAIRQSQEDALRLRRDSEVPTEERDRLLGVGKGQTSKTKDTVLYLVCSVRDLLLGVHRGEEQQLGLWGFTVDKS